MLGKDLISIIVPIYNTERYLRNCIESILNQTYSNIKIILVDDGSTDNCPAICDEYAKRDNRVVVIHKKNEGQGVARNVALDTISDGYIAFVDSDDYISKDMYKKLLDALLTHNADIAVCGINFIRGQKVYRHNSFNELTEFNNESLIKEYISTDHIFTGMVNKLYKAELFTNICFPSFRANEDCYVLPDILKGCKKGVCIGESLYFQNIRYNSTEQAVFSDRNLVLIDCAEKLMYFIKTNYSHLYHYVAAKKINDIVALMAKIRIDFSLHKNKDYYIKLNKMLLDDYYDIKKSFPTSIKRLTMLAVEHKVRFSITCIYRGIKRKVRKLLFM